MRIIAIEVTETTAIVELRPSWLAWLFGARTVQVHLRKDRHREWGLASTERALVDSYGRENVPHGKLIRNALDYRPVAQLPVAEVRR